MPADGVWGGVCCLLAVLVKGRRPMTRRMVSLTSPSSGTAPAANTFTFEAYNTTAQQDFTIDSDYAPLASSAERRAVFYFDESSLTSLMCGTTYRVAFAPKGTGTIGTSA